MDATLRTPPRYGLHVQLCRYQTAERYGQFYYVGTIPVELAQPKRYFDSYEDARAEAARYGWKACDSTDCVCATDAKGLEE